MPDPYRTPWKPPPPPLRPLGPEPSLSREAWR